MLRLGIAVLVLVLSAECWPASKEHGVLLERLRRSPHYCGPDYPEPVWPGPPPPPPPPAPLPPPPPHVYPLPAPIFPPQFWRGHHHHHHRYHDQPQRYQEQNIRNFENYSNNQPCSTCIGSEKPDNTAISNAQSESGNAVAIAILRSQKN